jgi:hypothetical protein
MDDGYANWTRLSAQAANAYRERRGDLLTEDRQQKEEPPPEPRKLDTTPIDWHAEMERAVGLERTYWRAVLPEVIAAQRAEIMDDVRDALRRRDAEIIELRATLAKAEAKLAEVRVSIAELALASDKAKAIDLPPLPRLHVN